MGENRGLAASSTWMRLLMTLVSILRLGSSSVSGREFAAVLASLGSLGIGYIKPRFILVGMPAPSV